MHLAVCDPLSCHYVLLPPLPDDLYTSVQDLCHKGFNYKCEIFLVPRCECAVVETSFKVTWMARGHKKLLVLIFSSVVGKWNAVTSLDGQYTGEVISFRRRVHSRRSYAYGCFYWKMGEAGKVLALDTRKMELFFSNIPLGYLEYDCAMVEAGEGKLGIFALFHHMAGTRLHLYYTTKKSEAKSTNEWCLEKTIQLPPTEHDYRILCATNGYLFMRYSRDSSYGNFNYGYILMDVKTFLFERFYETNRSFPFPAPYFGFPPSLSPPSI
uniref:Uncharacterized protein n=1 Tax=Avena sativa TaxID=4498 RepID=A0ACD5UKS3_AVESA